METTKEKLTKLREELFKRHEYDISISYYDVNKIIDEVFGDFSEEER